MARSTCWMESALGHNLRDTPQFGVVMAARSAGTYLCVVSRRLRLICWADDRAT